MVVTAYSHGWCMAANLTCARARRASAEFGDRVVFRVIDTAERPAVAACGFSDAVFVDGKPVTSGPPPSFAKLRQRIERRVRRLERKRADGRR